MFEYPEGLYVDVRIEEYNYTTISFKRTPCRSRRSAKIKGLSSGYLTGSAGIMPL